MSYLSTGFTNTSSKLNYSEVVLYNVGNLNPFHSSISPWLAASREVIQTNFIVTVYTWNTLRASQDHVKCIAFVYTLKHSTWPHLKCWLKYSAGKSMSVTTKTKTKRFFCICLSISLVYGYTSLSLECMYLCMLLCSKCRDIHHSLLSVWMYRKHESIWKHITTQVHGCYYLMVSLQRYTEQVSWVCSHP